MITTKTLQTANLTAEDKSLLEKMKTRANKKAAFPPLMFPL